LPAGQLKCIAKMRKIKKEEGAAWAAPFSYTIDVDKNFHIDIMRIRIILFLFLYDSFGGGLMTKNAEQILEIVNNSQEHLSAEQIYLRLKETNRGAAMATVYNNLSYLYKEGFIRKISVEGYPDRYDTMKRHEHLVCRRCGKLSDIQLDDLTEVLQKQVSVEMFSYDLKIGYLCEECMKEDCMKIESFKYK
jgi:Fe2+ or Zn2+ uptake regulation protein